MPLAETRECGVLYVTTMWSAVFTRLIVVTGVLAMGACRSETDAAPRPAPSTKQPATKQTSEAFTDIYRNATWGRNTQGAGNSGTGSTLRATVLYRALLQQFLAEHDIHSVVDAGCGDWEFSQTINWTGIDYTGVDIVPSVVAGNQRHAAPNIRFVTGNIVEDDLPAADLLISKHVLQHLPNRDVQRFLDKQLRKYKYVLLTNGVDTDTMSATNATDIEPGGYRPLDITKPPFNIAGTKLMTYWDGFHMHQVVAISRQK